MTGASTNEENEIWRKSFFLMIKEAEGDVSVLGLSRTHEMIDPTFILVHSHRAETARNLRGNCRSRDSTASETDE